MGRACSKHGKRGGENRREETCTKISLGQFERKRLRGRSRCRWEDTIKMDVTEIELSGMDWIHLVHDKDYEVYCF
jgi:hypothetical protein